MCGARAGREELFAALLRQIGEPGTLDVVVVEDIHWADEATVDMLRFVGRRIKNASVLLIATYRETVVLSLRAHHLVTQPLLAVGLVAVIRKILFVLSSEESVSTAELALLIAMIAVFVAALILVSRYDQTDAGR